MQYHRTIEEKAAEWSLSVRHVQYLCRNGRIEGAIKRAEVWFIPEDTPNPAQNTKSGTDGPHFVGTKKRIFLAAIKLFVLSGFDSVSLRDIAADVGIRQSTIYNHFKSKQEILDAIYRFYRHYYLKDRPTLQDMEDILKNKSLIDAIDGLRYDFEDEYRETMSDITKIIFQRIGIDDHARDIAKSLMVGEGIGFVEEVFNRAVKTGKIPPLDTHMISVFINSIRIFMLYNWIIDPSPERMGKLLSDEQTIYEHAARFLTGEGHVPYYKHD